MIRRLTYWKTPALLLVLLTIGGFCLANGMVPFMLLAWTVALTGWWFSERAGGQSLPRWAVLSLVLGVIVWAAFRANSQRIDVTVFCEFLTLVLIVKAWDRKRARDIAQLIAMSVFLVIGSILDTNNLGVGTVVLLCMPLTAWAVMAMQIGAGNERAALEAVRARVAAAEVTGHACAPRAPLASDRISPATARRLVPMSLMATGMGFFVALVVFLVVPRGIAGGQFGGFGQPSRTMRTGFTDEVELGRAGLLSESQKTVLEASFSDGDNNPLGGEGEVFYLRGAVLENYQQGRWIASGRKEEDHEPTVTEPTRDRTVVQEIYLRETTGGGSRGSPYFALWRNNFLTSPEGVPDPSPGRMWYRLPGKTGPIHYRVISVQQAAPPDVEERLESVSFPSEVIHQYAEQVLHRADLEPDPAVRRPGDDASVARILTGHLRGGFEYTTQIGSPTNGEDPIEWFLTKERKGHCEYFASALAALCRSVGVNARVIAGYVATEFDAEQGKYTVRESNAHAWTEVEVAPGVWLTYDPTPPVALMRVHEARPTWHTRLARMMDSLNDTWINSVVMFDNQQQHQLMDLSRFRIPWVDILSRQAAEDFHESGGRSVLKYMVVTAAVLTALVGLSIAAARAASDLGRVLGRGSARQKLLDPQMRTLLASAGFYEEALEILEKSGLGKPVATPPATHATNLARTDRRVSETFFEISEMYYRVRFGRRPLGEKELARATALVESLRHALMLRRRTQTGGKG